MRTITTLMLIISSFLFVNMSCEKENESMNPSHCVRGTVIYDACAGLRFVQMEGPIIGTPWRNGNKVWDNVIATNLPADIRTDSTISFVIERQAKTFKDACTNDGWACNMNISLPEKIYCVKNVNGCK
ncbi:hypothetical protein QNI19_04090 [Cytophagaceae bacterium DM2B3-1]|uniref:Uncharacterized protein n=1 Tax=Xanthocytophaga flava TaxID=3048013 RepID=A0ABT7CEL8_9BACT|nr:hypothetical protein [Xanthocytophaga flavus]MDJ1468924.1 hypothetical protein [Xanthocytophaga flavus]MDJ1492098.1 hypothetical protein [Xanthocytophaga flavus]